MTDQKVASIKGTITLADGSESEFQIGTDYGWSQWGAYRERLSESVPVLDAMVEGMKEAEVRMVSDYDPDDEDVNDEDEGDDDGPALDADQVGPLAVVDDGPPVSVRTTWLDGKGF